MGRVLLLKTQAANTHKINKKTEKGDPFGLIKCGAP